MGVILEFPHTYGYRNTQYLTEVSTRQTFMKIFYYIFSCNNTEEITLFYNVN